MDDSDSGYERMAAGIRAAQQRVTEIRATSESEDTLIRATVGGFGELVELHLDPRVYRDPDSSALASSITEVIHRAAKGAMTERFTILAGCLELGDVTVPPDMEFSPVLHELDRAAKGTSR